MLISERVRMQKQFIKTKSKMETIIHNECGCVHTTGINDDNCIKRTYLVADVLGNRHINISICNEYIRLMFMNKRIKENEDLLIKGQYEIVNRNYISDILKEIFTKYIEIREISFSNLGNLNSNELTNLYIYVDICDRPNIYSRIPLIDAIEICLKGKNYIISNIVTEKIKNYLENNNFKKYKNKYRQCEVILNKIKKEYNPKEIEILYNSIFTLILELNIKNK